MIDDIVIDLWSFGNFANMEDIRRKCNAMMDLSEFTSNKKKLSKVIALDYNKVYSQTLSFINYRRKHYFGSYILGL